MALEPSPSDLTKQLVAIVGQSESCRNIIPILAKSEIVKKGCCFVLVVCAASDSLALAVSQFTGVSVTAGVGDLLNERDLALVFVLQAVPGFDTISAQLKHRGVPILDFNVCGGKTSSEYIVAEFERCIIREKIADGNATSQEILTLFDQYSRHAQGQTRAEHQCPVSDTSGMDGCNIEAGNGEKECQKFHTAKLAQIGTMTASIAHEIIQPLNVIQTCGNLMLAMAKKGVEIPLDELSEMAGDILSHAARATGIAGRIRDFSKKRVSVYKRLNLNDPVRGAERMMTHYLQQRHISLDLNLEENLPVVNGCHNQLEQVFVNLMINAADAMEEKSRISDGPVEKILSIRTTVQGTKVLARVRDTGTGMSLAVKKRMFTPFYTTKPHGTGLGTAIIQEIIQEHGGVIDVESSESRGSEFILFFPAIV